MRLIKRTRVREFAARYPDAAEPLRKWVEIVREVEWANLQDVRRMYPHADATTVTSGRTVTVFNIGGNKFRLIVAIHYNTQRVYVLKLLTHAEYSKDRWKENL